MPDSLSEASSFSILFLENRTESMNATQMTSTTMDAAMATMALPIIGPTSTLVQRAMAIPLFL